MSLNPAGSGKISFDCLLCDSECSPPLLPCDTIVPERFNLRWSSLEEPAAAVAAATSEELRRQLPKNATFHDPRDDEAAAPRSRPELELLLLSSLTTFKGFSSALSMYFTGGRFEGLGFRQDIATIDTAQTSSKWSSSTMSDGSIIFVISSLSLMLTYGRIRPSHSFAAASSDFDALMPNLPVTSSSKTFPKQ